VDIVEIGAWLLGDYSNGAHRAQVMKNYRDEGCYGIKRWNRRQSILVVVERCWCLKERRRGRLDSGVAAPILIVTTSGYRLKSFHFTAIVIWEVYATSIESSITISNLTESLNKNSQKFYPVILK
jgi:hypothetical protein